MDLWIRSQDRRKLVKSGYLTLFLSDTNWFIYSDTTTGEPFEIGKYKTEERALEVLDEIQGKITQNECLKTMIPKLNNVKGEEEKIGKLFKEMVYEMPEE